MRAFFAAARADHPDPSASDAEWMDWARALWARVGDA
jgi:hypothetical protein